VGRRLLLIMVCNWVGDDIAAANNLLATAVGAHMFREAAQKDGRCSGMPQAALSHGS
jgi:hypothetical protein